MPSTSLLQRLKERKLVQWAIAYLAGAWVVYEVTATVGSSWGLTDTFLQGLFVVLAIGFFITLVIAWYHGEKGRQRVSGPELLMVAALLVVAGGVLAMVRRETREIQREEGSLTSEAEDVATVLNQLPSIAVLPFRNLSGVPEHQYFVDGIHGEILTRLSRITGLSVRAQTSVLEYRDSPKNLRQIGEELNARYIVEGDVQRAGQEVRINVQLIEAATDEHKWAETFDRTIADESLFDVQSEIVSTIAGHLGLELREEERRRAARRSTSDMEAYDLYLRGLDRGYSSREAISLFQQAIELDPDFLAAHAMLSMGLGYRYQVWGEREEEILEAARSAAEKAVSLAPASGEAQLAMGLFFYRVKDWASALEWLGRASGTLVGDFEYHRFRAYVERRMGRWRQSAASSRAALALSPRSVGTWSSLGVTLTRLQMYDEAEEALLEAGRIRGRPPSARRMGELTWYRDGTTEGWRRYLETSPASWFSWEILMTDGRYDDAFRTLSAMGDTVSGQHWWFPKALLEAETLEASGHPVEARGKFRQAVEILEGMAEETPGDERLHRSLGLAYAGLGMREKAVQEATRAVEIMPREKDAMNGPFFLFNLAAVYARLGEVDNALEVLEDLLSAPSKHPPNMLEDHFLLRPIHNDPRFKTLMDRERDRVF